MKLNKILAILALCFTLAGCYEKFESVPEREIFEDASFEAQFPEARYITIAECKELGIATLPPEATEADWEQQLSRLDAQIQRLGAINLAAIDEYEQQSERKRYLDAQNADLEEALTAFMLSGETGI